MSLDAIIIADSGADTFSGSSPLRLQIDGKQALIQVVKNYLANHGNIVPPIEGDGEMSWASVPKLNGIFLYSYLLTHGFDVALLNSFYEEKDRFLDLLQETPRVIIISTTFIVSKQSLRQLADDIREIAQDVFIIAGGPFVY